METDIGDRPHAGMGKQPATGDFVKKWCRATPRGELGEGNASGAVFGYLWQSTVVFRRARSDCPDTEVLDGDGVADDNREESRDRGDDEPIPDYQLTSSFPAGKSDADSWVAQWADLFDDEKDSASETEAGSSSTREMPIYQAEQPPVSELSFQPGVLPGHLGPTAPGSEKAPEDEGDAAEIAAWQKSQERTKRRAKLRANQRKARVIQRNRPAGDDIRADEPVNLRPSIGSGANRRTAIVTGALAMVGVMALLGYLLTGFGQDSDNDPGTAIAADSVSAAGQSLNVGADLVQTNIQDLALSTVQLVGLNDDLEPKCAGSGVIVEPDGVILTNAHVVTSGGGCQFTSIGVARTLDSSSAPELRYRAQVLAVDQGLDLAVVKIIDWLDDSNTDELPQSFPAAPLGDSSTVRLGDDVRILGYPVIGGDTITLTTGSVSGFTSQAGVGSRALIKTDATISAGNSGGMAIDSNGRVIGIPTKAQASETGPAIDCRPLSDTNADGSVDDDDNCVSVGGFLNGVRPINLASAILRSAATAEPIGPVAKAAGPQSDLDFDLVAVGRPRFSLGRVDNTPVKVVTTAEAGISDLCIFFDWAGIPSGTRWDGAWFLDGKPQPNLDVRQGVWDLGESGTDFWLCASEENEVGLPAGVYEVGFFLEGEVLFAEGIVLTEEPVDVVPVTWTNNTGVELCGLAVNPLSDSGQVGMNELDPGESIPVGESRTMNLPLGNYVVEAYNCDGEAVADNYSGLPVEEEKDFLIGIGPAGN